MRFDTAEDYIRGILSGNRRALAKAITLTESSHARHESLAQQVMLGVMKETGRAIRVGITGVPGVGKSTFIESLGLYLAGLGHRVAVLAVDPSSPISGGSILGDKTRMEKLSTHDNVYIRPSPSSNHLGGVTRKTREAMLLCEAAGFDVILVETVGVGQSEVAVASMVDFFLVLMLANAGDELQGIKKGVLELADSLVINKADKNSMDRALVAKKQYENAFHLLRPASPNWSPKVLTCSALESRGVPEVWETILSHHQSLSQSGELSQNRQRQSLDWMWSIIDEGLKSHFMGLPEVQQAIPQLVASLEDQSLSPVMAANRVLDLIK
ncbi:methylmalonyl Co-A mutase-associated GTPase MeaB [Dongshaea marina]|uniref:methylmalonyl Co-A mutase-associated GTPase MeaB n=1 Tax=Dongshaea marina TaxID=2047966 RepID=UPI000D3E6055|nr:methylmalonyl Co-A mutase-associated GTPase MeaB [Dongshaea marina]